MKELTIKEKAKAYDKALERAINLHKDAIDMGENIRAKQCEIIFPELKEREDNEIRKDIISNLKGYINCIKDGYDASSAKDFVVKEIEKQIVWLEKQGNKSINIDIESMVSSYKQRLKSQAGIRMENNPLVNMCLTAFRRGVENTLEELNLRTLEKQGEQEFIDSDTLIQQRVDTLADIDTKQSSADNVKPKVKNEIEIPFGAKDSELQEATYYIPKGFYAEIDDDKVVIKKGEKPITWSEEDEYILLHTINDLKFLKDTISIDPKYAINIIDIEREIDWLKSLKDRITWKPSEEQMKALHNLNLTGNLSYAGQGQTLIELNNDLLKLKA